MHAVGLLTPELSAVRLADRAHCWERASTVGCFTLRLKRLVWSASLNAECWASESFKLCCFALNIKELIRLLPNSIFCPSSPRALCSWASLPLLTHSTLVPVAGPLNLLCLCQGRGVCACPFLSELAALCHSRLSSKDVPSKRPSQVVLSRAPSVHTPSHDSLSHYPALFFHSPYHHLEHLFLFFLFKQNFKRRMDAYVNIGIFIFKDTKWFFTLIDIKFSDYHTTLFEFMHS